MQTTCQGQECVEQNLHSTHTMSRCDTWLSTVGFEGLTAVAVKAAIFRDIAPCSPYLNRGFGGNYHFHLQGRKSAKQETSVQLVSRNAGFLLGWFSALKKHLVRISETSVHIRAAFRLHVLLLPAWFLPLPKRKSNPVAWVRERTIPTERPPLVGEVSANFCG
jgi:hypothetical protein